MGQRFFNLSFHQLLNRVKIKSNIRLNTLINLSDKNPTEIVEAETVPAFSLKQALKEYIGELDWEVRENANESRAYANFLSFYLDKIIKRKDILSEYLPEKLVEEHLKGEIHIHKLPHSLHIPYCTGFNYQKILLNGLKTPTVISKPAKHLDTAVYHLVNFFFIVAQEWSGATAVSAFDLNLAPFIHYDRLNLKQVKQILQGMLFELNYPSRMGYQSPFTNITLMIDMIPGALEGEAIHGGKIVGQFQDYIDEIILVNKALTELYLEGDSRNQPFTFPIPTLTVTDMFDWNGRRWGDLTDTIFEALAKRGTFYILNGYTTDVSAIYSMCCRLTLDMSKVNVNNSLKLAVSPQVKPDGLRGMWAIPDATGSIGVITLNLPRIAARSAGNWDIFISQVYEKMEHGRKILSIWRTTYERNLKIGLMPMTNLYLQHLANHYSTIGIVGLPETAANLMGYNVWREGSKKEMAEAIKIEKEIVRAIREKTEEFEKKDGYLYNVEEIPAESAAYRLAKLDMERMRHLVESGDAFIPTEGGAPFYSNSVVPYYADVPIALRAEWEGEVQQEFTGGVMMHLFLYESPDPKALKRMIRNILTKTKIVYLSITPTISVCRKCGWNAVGIYDQCPKCNNQVDWWSRIVGYYRPVRTWNIGKKAEFNIRVQYGGENQETIRAMKYKL